MIFAVLLQKNDINKHKILHGLDRNGRLYKLVETTKESKDCSYRKIR